MGGKFHLKLNIGGSVYLQEGLASYDGQLVYFIPDKMHFYHLAFTDEPADPWAGVEAFKLVPREIPDAAGLLQFYAKDSGDGLLYDMSNADSALHFRKPMWSVGASLARPARTDKNKFSYPTGPGLSVDSLGEPERRQAAVLLGDVSHAPQCDTDTEQAPFPSANARQTLTSLYLLDRLEPTDSPSKREILERLLDAASSAEGLVTLEDEHGVRCLLFEDPALNVRVSPGAVGWLNDKDFTGLLEQVRASGKSPRELVAPHGESKDAQSALLTPGQRRQAAQVLAQAKPDSKSTDSEEPLMDKLLELLKALTDEQIRALEPVSKLLGEDKKAADAALAAAVTAASEPLQAQLDTQKAQLDTATATIDTLQTQVKTDLVDRLFEARKALAWYPEADLADKDKTAAFRGDLEKRSIESLRDGLSDLEPLRSRTKGAKGDTVSPVVRTTDNTGTSEEGVKPRPRFLQSPK